MAKLPLRKPYFLQWHHAIFFAIALHAVYSTARFGGLGASAQEVDSSIVHSSSIASDSSNEQNPEMNSIVTSQTTHFQECPNIEAIEAELAKAKSQVEKLSIDLENAKADLSQKETDSTKKDAEVKSFQSRLFEAKTELATAIAERNESFQTSRSLQEKMDRMEHEHARALNETINEIDELYEDIERKKKTIKSTEDRHRDTRKKLSEFDSELKRMHKNAMNKYVNFTLMQEDAWSAVERRVRTTTRIVESRWNRLHRHYRPQYDMAKDRVRRVCRKARAYIVPKLVYLKTQFCSRWYASKLVRPIAENAWDKVSIVAHQAYSPFRPIVNEMLEACRLSALSAIEETSKSVINHIDESLNKQKERMERERERERKRDPFERHHDMTRYRFGRGGRSDYEDRREKENPKPSARQVWIRDFFSYSLRNSERLVQRGTELLPLLFILLCSQRLITGAVLFCIGFPIPLIWLIAIAKLMKTFLKLKKVSWAGTKIDCNVKERPAPQCVHPMKN